MRLPVAKSASALTAAGTQLNLDLSRIRALPTATSRFRCISRSKATPTDLRAGQFVSVLVATDEEKRALPSRAVRVVRNANGQDFVYEHVAAERFAPRPVRIEPLDGERVLIAAGIEPGRRIVVQGAELLDHVR